MHRAGPVRSGVEWVAFNALFRAVRGERAPVRRIRYEDLAADPSSVIEQVVADVRRDGEDGSAGSGFLRGNVAMLNLDHTVAGNPLRFAHGSFTIRQDDDWRRSLPSWARRVTTALTWPLLVAYGYPLSPR